MSEREDVEVCTCWWRRDWITHHPDCATHRSKAALVPVPGVRLTEEE
jgi:hypothetical protein